MLLKIILTAFKFKTKVSNSLNNYLYLVNSYKLQVEIALFCNTNKVLLNHVVRDINIATSYTNSNKLTLRIKENKKFYKKKVIIYT